METAITCKDCLFQDVCDLHAGTEYDTVCNKFKDKAEWVHLPCKVGDTVWFDTYDSGVAVGIQPHKVIDVQHMICIKDDGDLFVTKINSRDFGVNTFLSKEEAQSALDKMKGDLK